MMEREDQNWTRLAGRADFLAFVKSFCLLQGLGKEVNKILAELYRSFSRVAALVSTAEANICCEELCSRILSVDEDWKNKVCTNVADVNKLSSFYHYSYPIKINLNAVIPINNGPSLRDGPSP